MIGLDTLKTEMIILVLASSHLKMFLLKENDEFTPNPHHPYLLTSQSLFGYVIICTPPSSKAIALLRRKSRHISVLLNWHRKQVLAIF